MPGFSPLLREHFGKGEQMKLKLVKGLQCGLFATALLLLATPAMASETWDELRSLIFKDKIISLAKDEIVLDTPYRATDDRSVPIGIEVNLKPDVTIKRVTLIIEENPMPVSAVFDIKRPKHKIKLSMPMRLNGPSTIRALVEASDGNVYMIRKFIKTSGLGACAAPPIGDPKELMANLGRMELRDVTAKSNKRATQITRSANLKIKHPNLTGLQMDQITLRYILARFVKTIEVSQGGKRLFNLTASISFTENPQLTFDYKVNEGDELTVRIVDTEDAVFKKTFPVGFGS